MTTRQDRGFTVTGSILTVGLAVLLSACDEKPQQKVELPPPEVVVTEAVEQTVPLVMDFSGTVQSIRAIDIIPRVSGYIEKRYFTEGTTVKEGAPLYLIDPRTYHATLDSLQADLQKSKANLSFWQDELKRYTEASRSGAVSKEKVDESGSKVAEYEAQIAKNLADIERAKLNLSFTKIEAPFAGYIENTKINTGQLVQQQKDTLTSLVELDPIYVIFNISRTDGYEIQKLQLKGLAPAKREDFTGTVIMPDGSTYPHQGHVDFVSAQIDPTTDSIETRLVIANPLKTDGETTPVSLVPGQYVPVKLTVGHLPGAVVIPQVALVETQGGTHVYVVGDDDKVEARKVDLGVTYGHLQVIRNGVKQGDRVIVQGVQKVRPGMTVKVMTKSEAQKSEAQKPAKSAKSQ